MTEGLGLSFLRRRCRSAGKEPAPPHSLTPPRLRLAGVREWGGNDNKEKYKKVKVEEEEKKGEVGKGMDNGAAVATSPPRAVRGAQITERDVAALGWLVEQRVASVSQVRQLLEQLSGRSFTDRRTWQIIARWEIVGLAERWRVWHGEQALVWPTAQAANLAGLSRWRRPGVGLASERFGTLLR